MTADQIISSALNQLDRDDDAQNVKTWQDRFIGFINEAVVDIARTMKLKRTDEAEVKDGLLDASLLPQQCVKVISVWREGKKLDVATGPDSQILSIQAGDGPVKVMYRYVPNGVVYGGETPAVPAYTHGLITDYVVARERATSDPSMQRGSNVYFELYQEGKRRLLRNLGEPETYKITNKW